MNVDNLIPGTKLIWDAPEPYEGYAKEKLGRNDNRVFYTCIVTNRKSTNTLLTAHIMTLNRSSCHWMYGEQEYLRLPTEKELETLEFPKPNNYINESNK